MRGVALSHCHTASKFTFTTETQRHRGLVPDGNHDTVTLHHVPTFIAETLRRRGLVVKTSRRVEGGSDNPS